MSQQPPSFRPEHARQRPDEKGAQYVGRARTPASERLDSARRRPGAEAPHGSGRRDSGRGRAAERREEPQQASAMPPSYRPARRTAPSKEAAGRSRRAGARRQTGEHRQNRAQRQNSARRQADGRAQSGTRPQNGARRAERGPQRDAAARTRRPGSEARRRRPIGRTILVVLLVLVLALVVWAVYLVNYGNSKLTRVDALVDGPDTPGTTYLIVGSDAREKGGIVDDPTQGMRADTIMVLHVPPSGATSLISLPRDSYVEIPGHGNNKLNSAIAYGGPKLLVRTVQNLTGLTIDHYVQIGMDGVAELADAVGGVNLCYDRTVDDLDSGLKWTAGCHDADGRQALAFSRMRKSDPLGDIGRTARQRQVISKILSKAASPATYVNPGRQRALVGAGAATLTVDQSTGLTNVAQAGLALRNALGPSGVSGTPPIASLNYRANGQSNVLLADNTPEFFKKVADGTVTSDDVGGQTK